MNTGEKRALTLYLFLHFVKDEVKELVVTLEHARHFFFGAFSGGMGRLRWYRQTHTFTTAGELDSNARVDVLG